MAFKQRSFRLVRIAPGDQNVCQKQLQRGRVGILNQSVAARAAARRRIVFPSGPDSPPVPTPDNNPVPA